MIPRLRERFNAQFSRAAYERFVRALEETVGTAIEFRVCETPVFLPADLLAELRRSADEIISQLRTPAYLAASERAIPEAFRAPGEGEHPHFIQVDFAVTRDADGRFVPRLVELQGCASLYAFQLILPQVYQRHYDLAGLAALLDGLSDEGYLDLLRRTVLGHQAPEHVILMEIEPERQKTLPDFLLTEHLLGVQTVAVTEVIKRGRRLFYRRDGREVEVRRIYNRVIIDELVSKGVRPAFDFRDPLEVEWAGHPNWFFRMSKYSLPFLQHPAVPRAAFLNQLTKYPEDLDRFVLKPLFSFAGLGVKVHLTRADLDAIPEAERGEYLLQEKIAYAPAVITPDEPSKVELRLMFLWPDDEPEPAAVTTLARLSKGAMMGVDFNKNREWVGSSCGLFEP